MILNVTCNILLKLFHRIRLPGIYLIDMHFLRFSIESLYSICNLTILNPFCMHMLNLLYLYSFYMSIKYWKFVKKPFLQISIHMYIRYIYRYFSRLDYVVSTTYISYEYNVEEKTSLRFIHDSRPTRISRIVSCIYIYV